MQKIDSTLLFMSRRDVLKLVIIGASAEINTAWFPPGKPISTSEQYWFNGLAIGSRSGDISNWYNGLPLLAEN
jgi:hypothetical protein